jgi:hypothetical protein
MSFTLPKPLIPILTKPIVPGWLLVAALVAQYALFNMGGVPESTCTLHFENIHYSTSVKRNLNKESIKLNVTSSCKSKQINTKLVAQIFTLRNGKPELLYKSVTTLQKASAKNPNEAEFLEFWTSCESGSKRKYMGSATGEVLLANGKTIPVSGTTEKFLPVFCGFKAK